MKQKLIKGYICLFVFCMVAPMFSLNAQALGNNSGSFQLEEVQAFLITKTNRRIGNGELFSGIGEPEGHKGQDFAIMRSASTKEFVYCIEPGVVSQDNTGYYGKDLNTMFNDIQKSGWNDRTSANTKKVWTARLLLLVNGGNRYDNGSDEVRLQHMAIQTLIWEVVCGERDANFNYVGTKYGYNVQSLMSFNHPDYSQRYWELKNQSKKFRINKPEGTKHSVIPYQFFTKRETKTQITYRNDDLLK